MQTIDMNGKHITLWTPEDGATGQLPLVYLNVFDGDGADVWRACQELGTPPFALAAIGGLDWNRELSPWPCDGTVRNSEPFAGQAAAYLDELAALIVPAVEARLSAPPAYRALAGYSLAGLFALWAPFYTDVFDRVASVSGSLWFPDFVDFARTHGTVAPLERAYLSLGKKETRTPNRMMRHVLAATQDMHSLYSENGVESTFELNPGNHFSNPAERCAKALAWTLG